MKPSSASRSAPSPRRLAAWRRALLAWLILALPLHAVGTTITQWLGARHFHTSTAVEAAMADWQFLRRIEIGVGAEPSASMRVEMHAHAGIERHRHSSLDGSVVALDDDGHDRGVSADGSGSGGSAAGAGAAPAQPFVVPCLALAPADAPAATAADWPVPVGPPPPRLAVERLERPPQA